MEYKTLSNGVKMPKIGFGVYQISKEECERCVLDALSVWYSILILLKVTLMKKKLGQQL